MATLTAPSGRRKTLSLDMTPMVDLAFLLLTFFVLTTSLNKSWILKMEMPSHEQGVNRPPIDHKRVLNVVLSDNNKIHWYMGMPGSESKVTDFSISGIRRILMEKKQTVPKLYVLIKPSDQSQYQNMIDILDEMMINEIEHYTIVDMEPEDKNLSKL